MWFMSNDTIQAVVQPRAIVHTLRVVASFALLGTVTAGALFGWVPALGAVTVHEIGAVVGAAAGVVATVKHVA